MSLAAIEIRAESAVGFEDALYQGIAGVERTLSKVHSACIVDLSLVTEPDRPARYCVALKLSLSDGNGLEPAARTVG